MTLNGNRYLLLDKLRFGQSSEERNLALRELIHLEEEGEIKDKDFSELLEDEDPVFQNYAVGAVGRQKVKDCIPRLKTMFAKTNNPMILITLIQTFTNLASSEFVDIVLKRLEPKSIKFRIRPQNDRDLKEIFDEEFILDQILVPALKYFQLCGNSKVKKLVRKFLKNGDPLVRWHAMEVCKKLNLDISKKELTIIAENDSNNLNREQANLILVSLK